ncbi:MAG: TIGR00730 family Rossman fold protein [Bacteroidetes bacterium]|nr:TIGR00730 family Rossman fold protein [Bacteroidota bacterium]
MIKRVCVYCASSDFSDKIYLDAAYKLGEILAEASITIVYGGGSAGLMGMLANGALSKGGKVIGIIPQFMYELEWGHEGLTELQIVNNMNERKELMMMNTDAAIALPGGSGTLEELFETITLKRLGVYLSPIIFVNIKNYFDPCIQLLDNAIEEKFMDQRNKQMWKVVDDPDNVLNAIKNSPAWTEDARHFATLKKDKA